MIRVKEVKEFEDWQGFVMATEGLPIFATTKSLDDKVEGKKKRKIGVSISSGCPVGCIYCFTRNLPGYRHLTSDEIVSQVGIVKSSPWYTEEGYDEVKVEFKEMGDPALNVDSVCDAINELNERYPGMLYVVSTSCVANPRLYDELAKVRENGARIRLTFSVHTTSDEDRRKLSPNLKMMTLEDIAKTAHAWYNGDQRVTLNFVPFDDTELDYERIDELFDPDKVFIKISYIDDNRFVQEEGLQAMPQPQVEAFVDGLRENGYAVAYRNVQ